MVLSEEVPFLKPIENTTDITTEIIRRCEQILCDDVDYNKLKEDGYNFTTVIPYGNPEDPCFQANQVFKFINPNEQNVHRRLGKYFTEGRHYFKAKITNDKRDPPNMLTRKGLMKAMYMGKTKLAETFQDYVFTLLDGLWKRHKEVVVSEMKAVEKQLEEERGKRREAEIINKQNIFLREAYCNDFSSNESNETELAIMRRQYLTTYYVYLVDWQYVNAKYWKKFPSDEKEPVKQPRKKTAEVKETVYEGIDLNSDSDDSDASTMEKSLKDKRSKKSKLDVTQPHKNGIQEPYEMNYINMRDLENGENEEYYFYISAKECTKDHFKLIMPIQLDKTKHYTEMINYIINGEKIVDRTAYPINSYEPTELANTDFDDNVSTPVSKVYKTTYDILTSARSRSYITMNRELLIGMNNKKRR